jgi:hypothetical protein
MTREDSLRTKMWVTEDGRYLTVNEISDDHLHNIRRMMLNDLSPGYDLAVGRKIASAWMAGVEAAMTRHRVDRYESLLYTAHGTWDELDRDAYAAAWLQIIDDELALRGRGAPHEA